MTWKLALYDFIHVRNQMETDYNWTQLMPYVTDEMFLQRVRQQQERRLEQHRRRGLVPVRSETRLAVRHIEETEAEVHVRIVLSKSFTAALNGKPVTEERSETEALTFRESRESGKWLIHNVSMSPHGDQDKRVTPPLQDGRIAKTAAVPQPFLNRQKLAPYDYRPVYNREAVVNYANQYWNSANPAFLHFDVDCSNYVSQCILAGGLYMDYSDSRARGWWYRGRSGNQELWSYSWAVANALQLYLGAKRTGGLRVEVVQSPKELMPGDVISYSWEGDGRYGHSTIVTGFDPDGMPLVNAHTVNSKSRYWDYSDSYAWTERTQYRFFHITDS